MHYLNFHIKFSLFLVAVYGLKSREVDAFLSNPVICIPTLSSLIYCIQLYVFQLFLHLLIVVCSYFLFSEVILTLGNSRTVMEFLCAAKEKKRSFRVFVAEGAPRLEKWLIFDY